MKDYRNPLCQWISIRRSSSISYKKCQPFHKIKQNKLCFSTHSFITNYISFKDIFSNYMGNSTNHSNERFLNDWVQLEKEGFPGQLTNVWAKKNNRQVQMQEFHLHVTSEEEVSQQKKIHTLRHNHPQLVSSLYFVDQSEHQFCASNYQGKIFIQKIPLTLQTVTDIPFPDALHVYSQSLQGFHILASEVENGCFPISQQHIGINGESVCKVWMNNKYDRNYPSRNQRIPQERMVKNIIQTIQQNLDLGSLQGKPQPSQYIYSRSKSPTDVKFGEAINLLRNYINQFFGGLIPQRLNCVDKVGGASLLSKNWKVRDNLHQQMIKVHENQYDNGFNAQTRVATTSNYYPNQVSGPSTIGPYNTFEQNQNSYTTFKREQPIVRPLTVETPVFQPSFVQPPILQTSVVRAPVVRNETSSFVNTPNFREVVQSSQVRAPMVQSNIVQQFRPMQQIVYTNPIQQPQFVRSFSQQPLQSQPQPISIKPISPVVISNVPMKRSTVNFVTTSIPQSEVRESRIENRIINVQTPQPFIVNQPQSFFVPTNVAPQPTLVTSTVIAQQPITTIKRSTIKFTPGEQPLNVQVSSRVQEPLQQPIQVFSNNYEGPEKVDSKIVFLEKNSPLKGHIRNNEESISSINAQTNPVRSNQQFSYIKQESVDGSRNYYNNFINSNEITQKPVENDYTSNYAAYRSKLYDNEQQEATYSKPTAIENTGGKYSVSVDDGMSSAAFLNELKSMKLSTGTFKKTQNNFDFGKVYETTSAVKSYGDNDQLYKVDYQDYTKTLTDKEHTSQDINVVGRKVEMTPIQSLDNNANASNENNYRMSFQYQQGETPSGDIRYESEYVKVNDKNGLYEEQYYEESDYQSTFDRYAKYNAQPESVEQSVQQGNQGLRIGQNLQTQLSRAAENVDYSKNSANTTAYQYNYNANSPQKSQEYKVDFDPEILADLQKLKGVN